MVDRNDTQVSNLGVLGIAVSAAGIVGSVVAALMAGKRNQSKIQREVDVLRNELKRVDKRRGGELPKAMPELKNRLENGEGKIMKVGHKTVETARQQAERAVAEARQRATYVDAKTVADTVRVHGGRIVADARQRAGEVDVQGAADTASANAKAFRDAGKNLATTVGADLVNRATDASTQMKKSDLPNRAREASENMAHEAKSLGATIGESLRQNAVPLLKDVMASASDTVDSGKKGVDAARKRTESDLLPGIKEATGRLANSLTEATHTIVEKAHDAEGKLAPKTAEASGRISNVSTELEERSRRAAASAGQGAKDATSVVIWGAAAAGLAYLAFLNPEQREKVKQASGRVYQEAKAILADIRGYDGEF